MELIPVPAYGAEAVGAAIASAHELGAYSSDYIVNLLEQRARRLPEPGPLHLTRAAEALETGTARSRHDPLHPMTNATTFEAQLRYLKLAYTTRHHAELTAEAASQRWSHAQFLRRIIEAEAHDRQQHALQRRIKAARFPVKKTLDQFQWD